jgi:DNA-binding CsgD family transcriptional regulator
VIVANGYPLLERESVLGLLESHLERAAQGEGRLVLLRGEAGAGKTAVVRRFADRAASGARVLIGGCDPLSTPDPLGPVLDVVAELSAEMDRTVAEALAGRTAPHTVFRTLFDELRTHPRPTVMVIEDLHWADGATCDLLRYLSRRIGAVPVLLLGTYRDDEIGGRHPLTVLLGDLAGSATVHRANVEPLSRSAVATLAADLPVDPANLYQTSGGNPFFVTELISSASQEIPASVSDVVLGRLARLDDEARAVAEAVAVIGSPAELRLVEELVPTGAGAANATLASGLLRPDGAGIGFRHELARMAVWASIPGYRRMRLHGQVLAALRSEQPRREELARLAYHAEQAGDGAAALEFAPAAAAHAEGLQAHAEAAAQYQRALRYAGSEPADRRAPLLEGHGVAAFRAGDTEAAIASLQTAVELRHQLGDRLREGDDLRWLAHMLRTAGRMVESSTAADAAERILTALPPSRELGEVYVLRCLELSYRADVDATATYARRATELAVLLGAPRLEVQARYYVTRAEVTRSGAGWDELECALEAAAQAGVDEHTGFLFMTASAVASLHRDQRGRSVMRRAEEFCASHEMLTYLLATRAHGTLHPLHRGRWSEASDTAAEILAHPRAAPIVRPPALAALGLVRARRGDPDADEPLDEAAQLLEPGFILHLNPVWEARAEAAWLRGDHAKAEAEARRGLAALTPRSDAWLCGALMRWVRLAGGEPPPFPAAEPFALELCGDWRGAAAVWERLDCPYDAALARLDGDVPALLRALQTFESLGARPAAAIANARLRDRGVRPGSRGPRSSTRVDPHGLTARQREILELVADGLTDPQVAAQLYLSAKTVNHHVTAVLAKLGVHTRADAIRKVAG